ncbi:uncharacterized protein LOC112564922 isoform X1 [Pomacea canaliculata]|uniref:uncharacterized protein LOC112564922 isoform X1 n=1 Tax=Pomacea canaliculata TaxID=400727 RepID=UPI000D73D74D|nr:uncharacterized protein LOC112564922 isoform X1 [Pomacea canaliculata]
MVPLVLSTLQLLHSSHQDTRSKIQVVMSTLGFLLVLLLPALVAPYKDDFLEELLEMMDLKRFSADVSEESPERQNLELLPSGGDYDNLAVRRHTVTWKKKKAACSSSSPGGVNWGCGRKRR